MLAERPTAVNPFDDEVAAVRTQRTQLRCGRPNINIDSHAFAIGHEQIYTTRKSHFSRVKCQLQKSRHFHETCERRVISTYYCLFNLRLLFFAHSSAPHWAAATSSLARAAPPL
jgi:hypothetical protein